MVLSIIASKQWKIHSIDIKSAFLQGKFLQRNIYVISPKEAGVENKLWKLKRGVYGLNDAARMWYFAVYELLGKLGCFHSSVDYGIFMLHIDGKLAGILISHVDDFRKNLFLKSI